MGAVCEPLPLAKDVPQRWALHCTHRLPLPENARSNVLDATFVVRQGRGHTDFPAHPVVLVAAPHHVKVTWVSMALDPKLREVAGMY